ncbi:gliding motility-associated C-terminal domain-containing protein [Aquimarina hainanensis]|uniref:Gliding motility-associated C-terminal domain-containing protein n=1 Tax=Aquimarina hainanensis TaxID=1578017 RepID=A0ABW5N4Z7_9FLAO
MKKKLNLSSLAFVLLFCMLSYKMVAQTISKPQFYINDISNTAEIACVNQNTPNRSAVAEYNGPSGFFGIGTSFMLELSDADGVFSDTTTTELASFTAEFPITPAFKLDFGPFTIPIELRGENFSLRVRAVKTDSSEFIGDINTNIPIYYFDTSVGVTLSGPNPDANNVAICQGESVTLTARPEGFAEYIWKFNGNILAGETGSTLENVTQEGNYEVQIDFGSCNLRYDFSRASIDVFYLNKTTAFIDTGGITPPLEFCPQQVNKLLSCNIKDEAYTYQWFLDGVAIEGANSSIYLLPDSNFAGNYTVQVDASDLCTEISNPVEVINLGSDILTRPPPEMILMPTEIITLAITTNAPDGSTIQWFENGNPITGATGLSITTSSPGVYRVDVTTNDVCNSVLQSETEIFIPTDFKPVIASVIDCDASVATIALENLFGITPGNVEVPLTPEQYDFFSFEWFKSGQTTGETGTTYAVNGIDENDVYTLEVSVKSGGFQPDVSNELTIEILEDSIEITADPETIPFNGSVTLSVPQNANYIYEWFRVVDGENTSIEGETTNQLVVQEAGDYFVRITSGECVYDTPIKEIRNEIALSSFIPNVVTIDGNGVNDSWNLPDELTNSQEVEITIYDSRGKVDLQKTNFQNGDWPENSGSSAKDGIYYFVITKNNSVIRKGSITVMR